MATILTPEQRIARTAELVVRANASGHLISMCASCGAEIGSTPCDRPSVSHGVCPEIDCYMAWPGMTLAIAEQCVAKLRARREGCAA